MLNLAKIERFVEAQRYEDLLEAVTENGRWLPLPVRVRLSGVESVELAALGLALQRATELAYGPAPVLADVADRLSEALAGACAHRPTPGAVASAMSGLLAFQRHVAHTGQAVEPAVRARVDAALRQGVYLLFEAQSASASGLIGDTIDAAMLQWHLAEPLGFRATLEAGGLVRVEDFERACRRTGAWKDSAVQQVLRATGGGGHRRRPARAA